MDRDHDFTRLGDRRTISMIGSLLEEGAYSKAIKLLSSTGMHDCNDPEVIRKLQKLHPAGAPCTLPPQDLQPYKTKAGDTYYTTPLEDRLEAIRKAVASFPAATGCGPSGLRAQHLQAMTSESDLTGSG